MAILITTRFESIGNWQFRFYFHKSNAIKTSKKLIEINMKKISNYIINGPNADYLLERYKHNLHFDEILQIFFLK